MPEAAMSGVAPSEWFEQDRNSGSPAVQNAAACFDAFDANRDGFVDLAEFTLLCNALFRDAQGAAYALESEKVTRMFAVFDTNKDNFIDTKEFALCWDNWITKIFRPVSGLLVVDVQNDFISGLLDISVFSAGHHGVEVVAPINALQEAVAFEQVFFTLDWHPEDHVSFVDNLRRRPLHATSKLSVDEAKVFDTVVFAGPPLVEQTLWPRHCVQNSWGAELHNDLKVPESAIKVNKGTDPEVDSYSGFWDNNKLSETALNSHIKQKNITDVYVCGIATDVCVGSTAADSLAAGYRTILIDDCCRGVDSNDIDKTKNAFTGKNGVVVHSSQVKAMVEGRDRRPELGYKLALELGVVKND